MPAMRSITCWLILLLAGWCRAADALPDGLYAMAWEGNEGRLTDRADAEGQVRLGKQLAPRLSEAAIQSLRNDNSLSRVTFVAGPIVENAERQQMALVVAGLCIPVGSNGDRQPDGTVRVGGQVAGEEAAKKIAEKFGVKPKMRAHPGHRLLVSAKTEKPTYAPREPVTLIMTIKNVGTDPIHFRDGGSQRGPRNNQFGFTAFRMHGFGKPLSDTGDPRNFGGLMAPVKLAPGETFTKSVSLADWFTFDAADTYAVTAMYRIQLDGLGFDEPLWDDVAVASCDVRVVDRASTATTKPAATP